MAAHRFSRRWLLVAAGAAGLVGAGAFQLPAAALEVDPDALRTRILGSVPPYVGYGQASGRLGLPEIAQLESVTALLTGTSRLRAFVAGPDRWRADELRLTGERVTYHLGDTEYLWDFDADQITRVVGATSLRLPRAGDLLPPDLARRLLALAPTDPVTALPARRIAGRTAGGLRLTPADPVTTVGRIDVWADPATALPLRVEVSARTGEPLLFAELTDVTDGAPERSALTPTVPPGAGAVSAVAADVSGALRVLNAPPAPGRLAGRDRVLPGDPSIVELPGVGIYGSGLATFVLIPLGHDIAHRAVDGARSAGGTAVEVPFGQAALVATPLLSVAALVSRGRGGLLVGAVTPDVLDRAVVELAGGVAR